MLKTCVYCGRIHDASVVCPQKGKALERQEQIKDRARKDRGSREDKFRHTGDWKKMREHILHRDRRLCLCCLAGIDETETRYETRDLSVHHIVPLKEDYSKRLDEDNLITLCGYHHEQCESGAVGRDKQRELIEKSINGTLLAEAGHKSG